jgi:predicted nucleic acid-binding protein
VIVVDSSVLIAFFRGHKNPAVERLVHLETEEIPFLLPGVCLQEVLQGARDEREWGLLEEYLGSQELLFSPNPTLTYREAARIYYDCRRRGLTIRSSVDCFIAQLTLEVGGALLHNDGDFESIAQVRPLQLLRS